LSSRGYAVDVLPVYRTMATEPSPELLDAVRTGAVDVVTFTSSSTVQGFCRLVGPIDPQPTVVSIGPITSRTARELGLRVDAEAAEHTISGLVATLVASLTLK
jgi:uroporphyrinogen III methyltransferase/synthase